MNQNISERIRLALEKSRAAWSNRNHEEDAAVMSCLTLRERIRSQFSMSMANLRMAHAFWCRKTNRLFTRSINRSAEEARNASRGSPQVPRDALFVGTYSHPTPADVFLEDLHDAILCAAHD